MFYAYFKLLIIGVKNSTTNSSYFVGGTFRFSKVLVCVFKGMIKMNTINVFWKNQILREIILKATQNKKCKVSKIK